MKLNDLFASEELHFKKLQDLVAESIREEELLSTKLLEAEQDRDLTLAQKLADQVAEFGGSWAFILVFFAILMIWIFFNVFALNNFAFDPYPFILLNLVLSCVAALQAPIIMMSQNRKEEKDRRRARSDYLVNLKAEIEVRNLHSKLDLLITEQMKSLFEVQRAQLELLEELQGQVQNLKSQL
jgi:uncharacterized membrane protein